MRQLVVETMPDGDGRITLEGRSFRYLVQVLRAAPGDSVDVRLPDGSLVSMTVLPFLPRDRVLFLQCAHSCTGSDALSGAREVVPGGCMGALVRPDAAFPDIILFQWILKGPKMDQVVRQATETGVRLIVPVAGERCMSREADLIGGGKTERWERIVREALQQSGSPVPTQLSSPVVLEDVPGILESHASGRKLLAVMLSEAPLARKTLHEYLGDAPQVTALAVGPEGGMSAAETRFLEQSGFVCVHFRTNVLRAETAALYGIAAAQSALLESEKWRLNV